MMNKKQSVIGLIVFLCLYGSEKLYLRSKIKRPVVFSCLSLSEIVIGPMKLQSYVNLRMFSRVVLRLAETSLFRLPYKGLSTIHWSWEENICAVKHATQKPKHYRN